MTHPLSINLQEANVPPQVILCVRGVLSPLLANVLLDEVDRALETRGHRFVRYADDCNVYVRSRQAGERVLNGLRRLYERLHLKVNEAKTAVAPASSRKFLGFSFWYGPGGKVKCRVADKAKETYKQRIRQLTRRSGGRSLPEVVERLRTYMPGWKAYFQLAQTPKVFRELDDAVEWIEDHILGESLQQEAELPPLEIYELDVFRDAKEESLIALVECIGRRSVARENKVFTSGDPADQLFLIRKGSVRISVPIPGTDSSQHRLTYGRGDFFGGMAFLSEMTRFNDAIALRDTELYVLQREQFERLREEHKRLACHLVEAVAKVLALRLRYSDKELMAMQE